MLQSCLIQKENEEYLLGIGYICISESNGIQTWADIQERGRDIEHWVYQYQRYVDVMELYSPREAQIGGAIYFVIQDPVHMTSLQTTYVRHAVEYSRADVYSTTR
jgi:hypothetical protein